MKIDGIDPLLLNKVKDSPDLKAVQKTEGSSTYTRVTREKSSDGSKNSSLKDEVYEERLEKALEKLNYNAEREGQSLRFKAQKKSELWYVEVIDVEKNTVIGEIPTDRALAVANRIQSLFGIFMDEKRV